MIIFSDKLDYALGWMVTHSLWQAMLIAIVFGVILIFLRKQSAKHRYIVANIALLTVLASSVFTFAYYYSFENHTITIDLENTNSSINSGINFKTNTEITPEVVSPTTNMWSVANFRDYFERNLPLIVTIWLVGVAAFVLRLLGGLSYIYYLKTRMNFPPDEYWIEMLAGLAQKAQLNKVVELVESAMVRTPMVVGHLKPMILFPLGVINRLSEKEVEAILAHEIAHILRHDYIFNILQSIVEALFYYHPAVWWISSQIRDEREMACDEIAINLVKDQINYAKALVAIQEMAFLPLTASLAFAGQRKGQFLLRMQRILNQPQNKSNIMEKFIATLIVLFTLVGLNFAQNNQPKYQYENVQKGSMLITGEGNFKNSGYWNGTIEGNQVCITFNCGDKNSVWIINECFEKSEFSNLPTEESEFTLKRAAGIITFKGKFEGNDGYGKQTFKPNESFKSWLKNQQISDNDDAFIFNAFVANVDESYIQKVKNMGLVGLNPGTWEALINGRVSLSYIEEIRKVFKENGYELNNAEEIANMKMLGVDASYVESLQKTTAERLSSEDIVSAKMHGLEPQKMEALNALRAEKMTAEEHLLFATHGIDEAYIKEIEAIVGKKLSNDDIAGAKMHGISTDYVNELKNAGISNFSFDDLVNFKIHGVTAEYIKSFESVGFKNLDNEDIVALKIANVMPNFISEMRNKGYNYNNIQRYIDKKYSDNISYADGTSYGGVIAPPLPPLPPLSPIQGKFGMSSDNNSNTYFYGDYKFIEKYGKITKAFYKSKKMSEEEIKARYNELEAYKYEITQYNQEALEAQQDALEAQREAQEVQREALREQQEALREQMRARQEQMRSKRQARVYSNGDGHSKGHGVSNGKESEALTWVLKQMINDKYIAMGKKINFSFTGKQMKVEGKQLPNEVYNKYKSNVERILGKPISPGFIYEFKGKIIEATEEGFITNGEITIDSDD